jgi:lysyl-tRNA synthetase, class II
MSQKTPEDGDLHSKEQEIYALRQEKARQWREHGVNPWGNGYRPKNLTVEIVNKHGKQTAEELEKDAAEYEIAGRVLAIRSFGKAAFIKLRDRSGEIQVHLKQDALGPAYELFKLVDVGDFVGVAGKLFRSKTGELTIAASRFLPLTKSLRPLPEKWHGLVDLETRYRQRYLDLIANPQVKETFRVRTELIRFIRQFLDERDFLEVETPMLHALVTGAAARPFITHHNALDMDLFLRIAPELHLKRLVVGGLERVYEINRNFRNEGISTKHNPEFTMLEFYQAYATYEDNIQLTEEMLSEAAQHVLGTVKFDYQGHTLDFGKGWKRVTMVEAIREQVAGLTDKDLQDPERLRHELRASMETPGAASGKTSSLSELNLTLAARSEIDHLSHGELIAALFESRAEHTLIQPTFVTEFPTAISPLARRNDDRPEIADRFELFVAGREIANGFSELNDPADQRERFLAQVEAKRRGRQETMDYDEDYIRALEHGLPPAAGEGIGIDRLVMLFANAPSIRDAILFPLLKPLPK